VSFLNQLIDAGILIPSGVDGLYGKNGTFEKIVEGIDKAVTNAGAYQDAEVLRFPPAMTLANLKTSGYMQGFPQLIGTVHCFCGNERDHQSLLTCIAEDEDSWLRKQESSSIVLTPAACYPIYPVVARRGVIPQDGFTVDVQSYCYRHEPSIDPTRMQLFRMREYVRIGTPEQVVAFREVWRELGQRLVANLELPLTIDVANDPFFGRAGKIMADAQRDQQLKFELLIQVENPEKPVACCSFNYHMDHFGELFNIQTGDGNRAHTACVGFGLERLTLAMLYHHGFDLTKWPSGVIGYLWGS
jgi:seryl-tRNA synthetase